MQRTPVANHTECPVPLVHWHVPHPSRSTPLCLSPPLTPRCPSRSGCCPQCHPAKHHDHPSHTTTSTNTAELELEQLEALAGGASGWVIMQSTSPTNDPAKQQHRGQGTQGCTTSGHPGPGPLSDSQHKALESLQLVDHAGKSSGPPGSARSSSRCERGSRLG